MVRVEKTVFISYRRTNAAWALAIWQYLTHNGYDVFFDYTRIASGDFETVILENIKARAHFIVLLTPSALERCGDPNDWLRREIETALDFHRNIVPLTLDNFDFGAPAVASQFAGRLVALKHYNALSVPVEYFVAAMSRLCERYLNIPLDAVTHPASKEAQWEAKGNQVAAQAAPQVLDRELEAQRWFERGFSAVDIDERVRCYGEAIRLTPNLAEAYHNRGIARNETGDLDGALRDFNEAIRLKPDDADAHYNRGIARNETGDLDGALRDFNEAIRLKPDDADAYCARGNTRDKQDDLDGALQDFDEAIRLKPDDADAYFNRGRARRRKFDLDGALRDFDKAIRLKPDDTLAIRYREIAFGMQADAK